ncbi:MAG: YicC/YloC family endoribonuclease [Planctomycetota bacterium]|nr:YicC/YloC family endoribonuclease [Planctomycetota bacterium]
MLHSMTGQGTGDATNSDYTVTVELRSVNNRHLKFSIRLPDSISVFDHQIESQLRKHLSRGSVSAHIQIQPLQRARTVQLDELLISEYVEQLRSVLNVPDLLPSPELLISLPGVISQTVAELNTDDGLGDLILQACSIATQNLLEMRQSEGTRLCEDILANLSVIGENLKGITAQAPLVIEQFCDRITDRINARLSQHEITLSDTDLIREIAIYTDKCDISEEIVRIGSHLHHMHELLNETTHNGRKLDFMTQELLREVNTIGSKANDVTIAGLVVDTKAAIERIKEQVQNIE